MPFPVSPRRCVQLNERRQATSLSAAADAVLPLGSGAVLYSAQASWMCKAVGCDLAAPLTPADVASLADFHRSHGAAPCIELTDHSHPDTFAAVAAGGLRLSEVEHVLAHPLRSLPSPPLPDGMTISPLDTADPAALRAYATLLERGFLAPGQALDPGRVEAAMRPMRHPDARGFVAHIDGQAVAASGMEVARLADAGVLCALWGTSVAAPYRRRGVQQALIAHRLAAGRAAGAELAVIESHPGIPTARNAARLGFSLTYTRLIFVGD